MLTPASQSNSHLLEVSITIKQNKSHPTPATILLPLRVSPPELEPRPVQLSHGKTGKTCGTCVGGFCLEIFALQNSDMFDIYD